MDYNKKYRSSRTKTNLLLVLFSLYWKTVLLIEKLCWFKPYQLNGIHLDDGTTSNEVDLISF